MKKGFKKIKVIEIEERTEYSFGGYIAAAITFSLLFICIGAAIGGWIGVSIGLFISLILFSIIMAYENGETVKEEVEKEVWAKEVKGK